ncbi:hypothetical protein J2736_001598 [Paenibacillus qinlingensis]|uniref:Group-specific protein n=2 Tax=Paenibacillus qinlingensis TaxID=1837343 RepID=A0ABU1NSI6_9BACL|nr:hypothetical protein [Paenibacillus qinlingensis]
MFIYHAVPKQMIGTKLKTLNEIKKTNPELHELYIDKYKPNRLMLLERRIPKLDCLWNDVIHFLPIHPKLVYNGLVEAGAKPGVHRFFYKIPLSTISSEASIALYKYSKDKFKGINDEVDNSEIELLEAQGYRELKQLPLETIDYYKIQISSGNKFFGLYHFVPHVFIKGEVDVEHAEIIDWNEQEI